MSKASYYSPQGGLPPQTQLLTDRAIVTDAYTVIPKGVLQDIVTSFLPHWTDTRAWILAKPIAGFSTTFSQYIVEVMPGGGSNKPEPEAGVEGAIFIVEGNMHLIVDGQVHELVEGGFAFIPPGARWQLFNQSGSVLRFHWIRKRYEFVDGIDTPDLVISSDQQIVPTPMPETKGVWATSRFVDPLDLRHDMHITIVTLKAGAVIPFLETHVMEHGLYVLEGKGVYRLNQDWVEVEAGDFMWLRAFCPQACYAGGPGDFRYLLYKDVNRHAPL